MITTIRPSHLLAATTLAASTSIAAADITGAYILRYTITAEDFGGAEVTINVADLYLTSDDPPTTALNIYNCNLPSTPQSCYFQSFTGTGWTPNNLGGLFDTPALRHADSFVTIGAFQNQQGPCLVNPLQIPGVGENIGLDPNFGGNNACFPGVNAGWYNGSPPNYNGQVGEVATCGGGTGLGVIIGRLSSEDEVDLSGISFELTWNHGLGTPGSQAEFTIFGNGCQIVFDDCK